MARPKKIAPTVGLMDYSAHDERKQLVQSYVPEAVETRDPQTGEIVSPKMHAYYGDESLPDSFYTSKGYEVVVKDGVKIQHNGSTLFKISHDRHAKKMQQYADLSVGQRDSAISGATTSGPIPIQEETRDGD